MRMTWKERLQDMAIGSLWAFGVAAVLFFSFEMGAKFGELKCRFEAHQSRQVKP